MTLFIDNLDNLSTHPEIYRTPKSQKLLSTLGSTTKFPTKHPKTNKQTNKQTNKLNKHNVPT